MLAIMHVLGCYLQISYHMLKFKLQFKIRNLLHLFADKLELNSIKIIFSIGMIYYFQE